ncbi:MAG: hypothetical protein JW763_06335 [candidate division Zixibacteria bacterium]|nr:hypothetical protein [candidate division Zixibacteria bacterium]
MKRLLVFGLIILICLPSAFARKKRPKSGDIDKNVYTDAEYDFKLTLLENWEPELQKPDKKIRLVLQQKDHEIPGELMAYPGLAKVPTLEFYIVEEPMLPGALVDSIASNSYKSDNKKEILSILLQLEENLFFDGLNRENKSSLEIDGKKAARWDGGSHFTKKLGMDETIPRTYGVGMIAVKNGKYTLFCLLDCEKAFYNDLMKEVLTMVESLKWPELK